MCAESSSIDRFFFKASAGFKVNRLKVSMADEAHHILVISVSACVEAERIEFAGRSRIDRV
jgi:hypothetical protein